MRVFISYSGPRGTKIAESLKYALDGVFPNVDVFCASERLHGKRWREGLRDALAASDFGIAVLTPDSHSAPWILFESGALTKGLGEAFFPIRYGLEPKDLPRPLEEFHGLNGHDFDEIFEFVRDIHAALNQREPGSDNRSETRLREDFDRQWVDLQTHVDEALSLPLGSSTETRRGGSAAVLDRVRGYYVAAATDKDLGLYTFAGVYPQTYIPAGEEPARVEQVYHYWADSERGSTLQLRWLESPDAPRTFLRASFVNAPGSYAGNVAIRPGGRRSFRPADPDQGFQRLTFQARAPVDHESQLDAVQLAIRVCDSLATQWMHTSRPGTYLPFIVEAAPDDQAWQTIEVSLGDLDPMRWDVFEDDGNWIYRSSTPDFSFVPYFVVEMGSRGAKCPGDGRGVVDLASFTLS